MTAGPRGLCRSPSGTSSSACASQSIRPSAPKRTSAPWRAPYGRPLRVHAERDIECPRVRGVQRDHLARAAADADGHPAARLGALVVGGEAEPAASVREAVAARLERLYVGDRRRRARSPRAGARRSRRAATPRAAGAAPRENRPSPPRATASPRPARSRAPGRGRAVRAPAPAPSSCRRPRRGSRRSPSPARRSPAPAIRARGRSRPPRRARRRGDRSPPPGR